MSAENQIQVVSPLFLLRSVASCWKCGASQEVVALATRRIIEDNLDDQDQRVREGDDEPVFLQNIQTLPSVILRHILSVHPQFEKRISKTADSAYYMNVCACGAHFGDFYLFSEAGGAFFPDTEADASRVIIEELPFSGTFNFECSYSMGTGAFIFEHAQRHPNS